MPPLPAVAALLLALPGCAWPGSRLDYNPETKEIHFERGWLSGEFYAEGEITTPDGATIRFHIQTHPNVDGAIAENAQRGELAGDITRAAVEAALRGPTP